MLYKLLNYNIDGKIYSAIKVMYTKTMSFIKVNNVLTKWFEVNNEVRQGNTLSPTIFAIYINNLTKEINLNLRINYRLSILLYADDMVLIAITETDLQKIASEMPVPHSLGKYFFNTMRYRSTVSVQSSGYFQSTISYIKVQTMFKWRK